MHRIDMTLALMLNVIVASSSCRARALGITCFGVGRVTVADAVAPASEKMSLATLTESKDRRSITSYPNRHGCAPPHPDHDYESAPSGLERSSLCHYVTAPARLKRITNFKLELAQELEYLRGVGAATPRSETAKPRSWSPARPVWRDRKGHLGGTRQRDVMRINHTQLPFKDGTVGRLGHAGLGTDSSTTALKRCPPVASRQSPAVLGLHLWRREPVVRLSQLTACNFPASGDLQPYLHLLNERTSSPSINPNHGPGSVERRGRLSRHHRDDRGGPTRTEIQCEGETSRAEGQPHHPLAEQERVQSEV